MDNLDTQGIRVIQARVDLLYTTVEPLLQISLQDLTLIAVE